MPVHDWRKVDPGIFHHFHGAWIFELAKKLNTGVLPTDYYALGEQVTGDAGPDVLTLQAKSENGKTPTADNHGGVATIVVKPPQVRMVQHFSEDAYTRKRKTLAIHHRSDDRIIALMEILTPGNKSSNTEMRRFLDKIVAALNQGIHLMVIDLFPPTRRDPQGIHGVILAEWDSQAYEQPADKPLTLVSYSAGPAKVAYVQPIAVGEAMPNMPLFLDPQAYVDAPLESAYREAWAGVPMRWREVLESRKSGMTKDEFHSLLRQYIHRQPFQPFVVNLIDGRRIVIGHERIVFSDGAASTIDPQDGALVEFFCEEVQTMEFWKTA